MKSLHTETYSVAETAGLRLDIPGDVRDEWLIKELERRGYDCWKRKDSDWETPTELSVRHGFKPNWMSSTLNRRIHPEIETLKSPDGKRVVNVRSNPEFEKWAKTRRKRKL